MNGLFEIGDFYTSTNPQIWNVEDVKIIMPLIGRHWNRKGGFNNSIRLRTYIKKTTLLSKSENKQTIELRRTSDRSQNVFIGWCYIANTIIYTSIDLSCKFCNGMVTWATNMRNSFCIIIIFKLFSTKQVQRKATTQEIKMHTNTNKRFCIFRSRFSCKNWIKRASKT